MHQEHTHTHTHTLIRFVLLIMISTNRSNNARLDGRTDGWTDGWMNEWVHSFVVKTVYFASSHVDLLTEITLTVSDGLKPERLLDKDVQIFKEIFFVYFLLPCRGATERGD